jgi:hypothetical protein
MHEKLNLEGKTRAMDNPEEIKAIFEMNRFMKKVHENYLAKSASSSIGAKDCWVYQNNA